MRSRTFRSTDVFVALAALLAYCVGCAANPATCRLNDAIMRFASDSVSSVMVGDRGGTAVYLGEGRWVTASHALGDASTISIDGKTVSARVLRRGEASNKPKGDMAQIPGDWVIFEAPGDENAKKPVCYDPDLAVAPGQEVYLIGYPLMEGTDYRPLSLIRTRAVARPWWLPKGLLYLHGPPDVLGGLSGGAAVVIRGDEVVMLGIYHGCRATWWPQRSLQLVVRPPK